MNKLSFIDRLFKDIENTIEKGDLEKANDEITKMFVRFGEDEEFLKKVCRVLGKYHLFKGDRSKSIDYFVAYEKAFSDDIEVVFLIADSLLDVGKTETAFKYIVKLMQYDGYQNVAQTLYITYKVMMADFDNALMLYKEQHSKHALRYKDYMRIAYELLLHKRFANAKEILLNGLSVYQGNTELQDEYEFILDIENFYKENIKKYYFSNIPRLSFKPKVYSNALRHLVEILTLRNYDEEEIKLFSEILIDLNKFQYSASDKVLAAIPDTYFMLHLIGDEDLSIILERYYSVKLKTVKHHISTLESSGFFDYYLNSIDNLLKDKYYIEDEHG
ncbi:MAG: hypothetical protein N3C60_04070 [Calditerrivibrio sp.]|nr:hypothetical protein [Calditerrivibrio sp.]